MVPDSPAPAPVPAVPRHVAVIMDGNGRWAKERGKPRIFGHRAGADALERVLLACRKFGVEILTVYAFSTENWIRPADEVSGLMRLLLRFLKSKEKVLHENETRLRVTGRIGDFPSEVQAELRRVMDATAHHARGQFVIALSYGGRAEIADAAKQIARDAAAGRLDPEAVDEAAVASRLYLPDIPDPDLVIRTSGEMRLSNFLLWEASYAELHFTPVLWPDFGEAGFKEALDEYARRNRRFGASQ
ncbi:MAG: di-trans,poly-cis-decaprenylcistransferase [Kiritimatiellae bacterium]|nr:di-trans,poly-cis-decaprenylcistransferase [Kiritimatiellia bacterium]